MENHDEETPEPFKIRNLPKNFIEAATKRKPSNLPKKTEILKKTCVLFIKLLTLFNYWFNYWTSLFLQLHFCYVLFHMTEITAIYV